MSTDGSKLSDDVVSQLELMYSSRATKIHVSTSLANLCVEKKSPQTFSHIEQPISNDQHSNVEKNERKILMENGDFCAAAWNKENGAGNGDPSGAEWRLVVTGVPILVYDTGGSVCRARKRLQLLVVNPLTGFLAFCQNLDDSCQYKRFSDAFHTFSLKTDADSPENGRKTPPAVVAAGLRFDREESAQQFYKLVKSFREEVAGGERGETKKSKGGRKKKNGAGPPGGNIFGFGGLKIGGGRAPFLRKTDISEPIWFKHVTSVKVADLATID